MSNLMRAGRLAAVVLATGLPTFASAHDIALTFHDGSVTIRGLFVSYSADAYAVRTEEGEIFVPAKYVTCEGHDCITVLASEGS